MIEREPVLEGHKEELIKTKGKKERRKRQGNSKKTPEKYLRMNNVIHADEMQHYHTAGKF